MALWQSNPCSLFHGFYCLLLPALKINTPKAKARSEFLRAVLFCNVIPIFSFYFYRKDEKEYALKQIEGTGISMSACREIAVSYRFFVCVFVSVAIDNMMLYGLYSPIHHSPILTDINLGSERKKTH